MVRTDGADAWTRPGDKWTSFARRKLFVDLIQEGGLGYIATPGWIPPSRATGPAVRAWSNGAGSAPK